MSQLNCSLSQIADVLRTKQRFLVMSHLRPDGDALGCTLAMGLCLRELGKDVTLWNEEGCIEKLSFLPGSELVQKPSVEKPASGSTSRSRSSRNGARRRRNSTGRSSRTRC